MLELTRHDYDTVGGIQRFFGHYPHFHKLLHVRSQAGQRKEPLSKFVVLKAFTLDQWGQLGKIEPVRQVKNLMEELPDCVEYEEFFTQLSTRISESGGYGITYSPVYLPPLYTQCGECGKYYGTNDCHDVIPWTQRNIIMPLEEYVGRQLWEVYRHLERLPDAGYFIHPELQIRNDRFNSMEPEPYFGSVYPENKHGWIGATEGVGKWYVIQPGDETAYTRTQYFHADCFKGWITKETRTEFETLFRDAGIPILAIEPTENKYGSFTYRGPWFNVTTPAGAIRVGWRKRVIEIELQGEWPVDCAELFRNEDVTVGYALVHAWSNEKAVEYLREISRVASVQD